MSINWDWVKPRLAKVPEPMRAEWMRQIGSLGRPGEPDPRTPEEIAEYLGVDVALVQIALAADPSGTEAEGRGAT